MRVYVNTDKYRWSHGKKPRGKGQWWFEIGSDDFGLNATYGEAVKAARKKAELEGVNEIYVLP